MLDSHTRQSFHPLDIYGDKQRIKRIFYQFTTAILAGQVIGILAAISNHDIKFAIILAAGIPPSFFAFYFINRQKFEWAAVFLSLLMFSILTILATLSLGIHNISNIGFPALLIVASMVTRKRTMVFLTFYAVACVAWLCFGELTGAFTPQVLVKSVPGDFVTTALLIILAAFMSRVLSENLFKNNFQLQQELAERKRVEDNLRENAIRYRTLLDNLPQLVWQRNLDSVFIDGNTACARTLGITVEELAGKTDYDFYPVDLAEKYRADDRRVIDNGVSETFEERFLTEGSERFARTTKVPLRDDFGRLYGTLGIAEDITESRLSEMALRESEQRFREVLENSLDASYKRNLKTNAYEYLSPVFEKIFSYTPDEFVQLPLETVLELIHPDDRAMGDRVIAEALSGAHGSIYQWDYRFRHKDGQYRWLHDQFIMMRDAQGQPAAWIGSVSDITELKRAEEDRIAREIAEQANRAKSEFISRMSHELRTPLNAILGFSQLLKMDELKPNQALGVEQIHKSGRHLLNLVNEVLDIARIESGKLNISPKPVRMADTLQEALELIRPMAEARGISISLETPASSDVFVQADPQSLRQVLLNLLSNAVKYNRDAGEIAITVSLTIDGHLRLQVRDTGEGIPPEKMERLFTPFDRLDRDSIEQEGTGLGLALSKGLVEAMGGHIGASSQPGVGSTFWLELKLISERLTEAILAEVNEYISEALRVRSRRAVVLYVEDNLDNLKLVEAIMERLPWVKLMTAMQGRLALELAQEHHPDLILLDLHLPDMHGSEILRRLKAEPAAQNIPVIILSADAMTEHIQDLLAGGARAYLTKPIDIQEFLKVVEESLAEHGR